jgi:hypothetical protein
MTRYSATRKLWAARGEKIGDAIGKVVEGIAPTFSLIVRRISAGLHAFAFPLFMLAALSTFGGLMALQWHVMTKPSKLVSPEDLVDAAKDNECVKINLPAQLKAGALTYRDLSNLEKACEAAVTQQKQLEAIK